MQLKRYAEYNKVIGIELVNKIPNEWKITKIKNITENLDNKRIPISADERKSGHVPYYGATGIIDYVKDFIFNEKLLLIGEDGAPFF